MSKNISTIPGRTYVVTLSQAGELSGVTDAGETMVLAAREDAGQVSFQAISQVTTCTDDGATVLPFSDAPLPIGVDGGASAAQVEKMVDSALYELEPVEQSTPAGRDNATLQWIDLDAQHVPPGKLESISLMSRSGGNPPTPSYLALWELGEDGATWSYLGSSMNNPGQTMNRLAVWEFEEDIRLSGRRLRVLAQSARSDVWEAGPDIGGRITPTPEGDGTRCYRYGVAYAFLPELSISVQQPVPKFVSESRLEEHKTDAVAHVSAEEHAWLGGVRAGSQEVAAPALTIKGSQNNNLLVVRGNQTNVSVTGSQMSFNVPQLSAMSDVPVLYRYDMASGSSEVWLAGAPDAERLAPMGITEAGTHVGAPSLPLYLRGSEVRINGTVLDVAGLGGGNLSEVEAHIDAHINNGSVHVTNWERERWNSLYDGNLTTQEKNFLARLVNNNAPPSSTGVLATTDDILHHENDAVAHVTAEERTRWNAKRDSVLQTVESAWRLDGGTVVPDPVGSGITIPAADVATTPLYCLPYPFPENSPRVTNVAHAGSCNVSGYVVTLNKMDPVAGDVFYIWAEFVWMPDGDLPPVRYEGCLKVTIV